LTHIFIVIPSQVYNFRFLPLAPTWLLLLLLLPLLLCTAGAFGTPC